MNEDILTKPLETKHKHASERRLGDYDHVTGNVRKLGFLSATGTNPIDITDFREALVVQIILTTYSIMVHGDGEVIWISENKARHIC